LNLVNAEGAEMRRFGWVWVVVLVVACAASSANAAGKPTLRQVVAQHLKARWVSQGANAWLNPPRAAAGQRTRVAGASVTIGSNVDAANLSEDLLDGQSETAIAASASGRVMAAWNDSTGFAFLQGNRLQASITGVGYSADGGRSFTDLVGLRNPNPDQQWSGDPTVVSIDGGAHFIVGSLFLPSFEACTDGKPAQLTVAVEVLTPTASGVTMGKPVVVSPAGDVCALETSSQPPGNVAFLDKDFLAWDGTSRTLAVSFTRFFISGNHSGQGEIDLARAHVPVAAGQLSSSDFHTVMVWPEEPNDENEGAYPTVAPGGDTYVAWERNVDTNLFNGDPHVYEHLAYVPADASTPARGGKHNPVVVTRGQVNATPAGGVRSLDGTLIAGYNRGTGNDFPRIAWNRAKDRVDVVWNDGSLHPLGDIWVRSYTPGLAGSSVIGRANDGSDFALHFLPAVSVRSNGRICTSWYDRSRFGPDSAHTDYVGECRAKPSLAGTDFTISTGATDWTNTSSLITPNFGDYTDQTSVGLTTYYTWSDGRLGVPQPFTDER
jgi:hypothetical protein